MHAQKTRATCNFQICFLKKKVHTYRRALSVLETYEVTVTGGMLHAET